MEPMASPGALISGNFKLQGADFARIVSRTTVILGRTVDPNTADDVVDIGRCPKISREHVSLFWHQGSWHLTVLSKNGAMVDKIQRKQGETVVLHHLSAIRIGTVRFFFMLPQPTV